MEAESFNDVFDALAAPSEAASLKARAELLSELIAPIQSWQVTQEEAAGRLAITRPRLNGLLRAELAKFSLTALSDPSVAAGLTVQLHVSAA